MKGSKDDASFETHEWRNKLMDKIVRDYLIKKMTASFSDIGDILGMLLSDNDGTAEKDCSFTGNTLLEDRTGILNATVQEEAEATEKLSDSPEQRTENTPQKKTRKTSAVKTAKASEKEESEEAEKAAPEKKAVEDAGKKALEKEAAEKTTEETEKKAPEVSVTENAEERREETPSAPVEQPETEGPAPGEEEKPQSVKTEVKEDEETIRKKLKDDMTALALKEKGFAIQKGLADYKVSRISEVPVNDIDDFRTRVYYYAGELEVANA